MVSGAGPVAAVVLDSTATLRPTGMGRYFTAAFLGIWLLGWAPDLYRLVLRSAHGDRTIQSAINDEGEIVDCARWFASRTGFELQLRR